MEITAVAAPTIVSRSGMTYAALFHRRLGMGRSVRFVAVVALVVALLAAGCASSRYTDWTGLTITKAIKELGRPTETMHSGEGTVAYVFDQTKETLRGTSATDPVPG
jgi:hypothetical protein